MGIRPSVALDQQTNVEVSNPIAKKAFISLAGHMWCERGARCNCLEGGCKKSWWGSECLKVCRSPRTPCQHQIIVGQTRPLHADRLSIRPFAAALQMLFGTELLVLLDTETYELLACRQQPRQIKPSGCSVFPANVAGNALTHCCLMPKPAATPKQPSRLHVP
ncbi:hypothetical protein B0J13DRAFT_568399 [Dactylonectria estremocensis]|uniref:Uncharacterized protein n=1 Tax=Dactylonectria estremocensis TaxID=1079267 RepID=A0A9P9DJK4_9HYPO|nr:hypothetical protein B0J13DRAFT_568399 [Dactylonectria estremocensis]